LLEGGVREVRRFFSCPTALSGYLRGNVEFGPPTARACGCSSIRSSIAISRSVAVTGKAEPSGSGCRPRGSVSRRCTAPSKPKPQPQGWSFMFASRWRHVSYRPGLGYGFTGSGRRYFGWSD